MRLPHYMTVAFMAAMSLGVRSSTSCTPNESSPSGETNYVPATRNKAYASLVELEQDSSVVVIGVVNTQEVVRDLDPDVDFTVSEFAVSHIIKGEAASTIKNRQTGPAQQGAPAELLTAGQEYLLYLTPSGLLGETASQYYVTGLGAGSYEK